MGSLVTRGAEIKPTDSAALLDVLTEDKQYGDIEDAQVVDLGDETQPVDFGEETQIMDVAGETQVIDDYDFIGHMDNQMLDVSDNETKCESNGEGTERTQLLHEAEEIPDGNGEQTTSNGENTAHNCHQDDGGASTDMAQSSGSLKRGITAIRTASLRAAGLAARSMASKNADNGSCSAEFSSGSSKLHSLNDYGGISNVKKADAEHGTGNDVDKGLSNANRSKVARSLARKLFMEEDIAEDGSHGSQSGQETDLSQLTACDNDLAGLTYVDSQEPGDLSQAIALEFVDKFLKVNVLESDQEKLPVNAVDEIVSPSAIAKGPQSVAQQANLRSALAGASVFDWDESHEDEGGGEFFIKMKEVLFGNSCGAGKYCTKPQSSRHHELRGSLFVSNFRNEKEQQNIDDKIMGFAQSDSKLVTSRRIGQLEEINRKKKVDNKTDQQLGLGFCRREVLAAGTNAEFTDVVNVGIDTQMAAEAMEALSTANPLVKIDGCVADQGHKNGRVRCKREATKKGLRKKSIVGKRPHLSKSGVCTRSKRTKEITMKSGEECKSTVALRTRSRYVVREFNVDVVKPKGKQTKLNMKNISTENERESSDTVPVSMGGKNMLEEELDNNGFVLVKRHSVRRKISSSTAVTRKTRQQITVSHLNNAGDESGDSRRQRNCLDVLQACRDKRKRSTRIDVASENSDSREEALNLTSVVESIKVDGSSCGGRDAQHTSNKVNAFVGHEVALQSVARRTRSRSSARCAEVSKEGKGLQSREMLSSEVPCQLSSKKHKTCSPAAKGAELHAAVEESPKEAQKSSTPANITPVSLKTPRSTVSPVCVGDEYPKPSCKKKKLSIKNEFYRLSSNERKYSSSIKYLRQRRDIGSIRVLFSQHLDEDIVRKQKKIMSQLGVLVASSISNATHFVADVFVRTRTMLEAIANGKPVVTHLWLKSCGQASCIIDEKDYILRDAKKESELDFSMPFSLACASRHPLLEGRRVLITPNIKPGKELISSLVKAVHGQAIERLCRTMSNNDRLLDDLLVLSCEEDLEDCVPLLEKGIAVYSSELLLDGIITQKLEYERYRILVNYVKKTRTTLWVKKNGD